MKKIVFYIPAILFIVFYGWLAIIDIGSISPIVLVYIALFLIGAFCLNKDQLAGGFLGVLPGMNLIYMSTQDTGQIINIELPMGIIIVIFFLLGSGLVFIRASKKKKSINN
ncbi:MAG: hypothetical protein RR396_03480 [Clostridiales bacterium]